MAQQDAPKSSDGLKQTAIIAGKTAKAAFKVAVSALNGTLEVKVVIILVVVIFFLLVALTLPAATSTSQMDDTYYMSIENGDKINAPSEKERDAALNDEERAKKKTTELLEIVTQIKQKDLENNVKKTRLKSDCKKNGWDYNLTFSHAVMDHEVIPVEIPTGSEEYDKVQSSFDLSKAGLSIRRKFTIYVTPAKSQASKAIYQSEHTFLDDNFYKYRNGRKTDYLVRMGSFFGGNGNRYKITFKDNSSITVLKAEEFSQTETSSSNGMAKRGGGLIEFVVSSNKIAVKEKLDTLTSGKEIEKIEMLGSEFVSQRSSQMSSSDSRLLAAYSVFLDNMQLEAVNTGLRKKIVNQRGDTVESKWIWSDNSIDLEESLKDALNKFLGRKDPSTGRNYSFYELDYKRDKNGRIIVNSVDMGHYVNKRDPKTGKVTGKKWVSNIKHYATPIIIELDLNSLVEAIFNLEPEGPYINSGAPYKEEKGKSEKKSEHQITIREAINTLAENTDALLFNISGPEGSNIIISDLQGILCWPAPGATQITSQFGYRNINVAGASTYHQGIDIAAPLGTPVVAVEEGVVTYAGYYGGGGNWVSITHGKKIKTNYGHLQKIVVSSGQPVSKGQVIAYSGNTGISSGPHLHFEVIANGKNVNPLPYVRG